jgi:sugar phosphate isomerase/epimerase
VCTGTNPDGGREILSTGLFDSGAEVEWESFFDDLKERGLKGVELAISDGHKGIQESHTEKEVVFLIPDNKGSSGERITHINGILHCTAISPSILSTT